MPALTITKTYADLQVLTEADLDNIKDDVEAFLNVTKLDDDNIQDGGVTPVKLTDITDGTSLERDAGTKILRIKDSGVTTAKIADDAVTTQKLQVLAVTTAKIADEAVTTAKIDDQAVTMAKVGTRLVDTGDGPDNVRSATESSINTASTSFVDMGDLNVEITQPRNRAVLIVLQMNATSSLGMLSFDNGGDASKYGEVRILRDGVTEIGYATAKHHEASVGLGTFAMGSLVFLDTSPGNASVTYEAEWRCSAAGCTFRANSIRLHAYVL
jgi:hypothetical protein